MAAKNNTSANFNKKLLNILAVKCTDVDYFLLFKILKNNLDCNFQKIPNSDSFTVMAAEENTPANFCENLLNISSVKFTDADILRFSRSLL